MSAKLILRILGVLVFGSIGIALSENAAIENLVTGIIAEDYVVIVLGVLGAGIGFAFTPALTIKPFRRLRKFIQQLPAYIIYSATGGLFLGLALGGIAAYPISLLPSPLGDVLPFVVAALLGYVGVMIATTRTDVVQGIREKLSPHLPSGLSDAASSPAPEACRPAVLLDTSVIIDGRIADICRTGFIQGELVVPLFVLNELQHVADSADTLRRNRGRRGLEILRQLQEESPVPVRITDAEVPDVREVDDKLIALAKEIGASILTNDYNLNRVAELQSVTVLNVNELANAVKTVLLPGEDFAIHILQEGKEPNQGVGYLDDGTMVVVEDGAEHLGATLDVTVSKVLQTAAGRMIFARLGNNR